MLASSFEFENQKALIVKSGLFFVQKLRFKFPYLPSEIYQINKLRLI